MVVHKRSLVWPLNNLYVVQYLATAFFSPTGTGNFLWLPNNSTGEVSSLLCTLPTIIVVGISLLLLLIISIEYKHFIILKIVQFICLPGILRVVSNQLSLLHG